MSKSIAVKFELISNIYVVVFEYLYCVGVFYSYNLVSVPLVYVKKIIFTFLSIVMKRNIRDLTPMMLRLQGWIDFSSDKYSYMQLHVAVCMLFLRLHVPHLSLSVVL